MSRQHSLDSLTVCLMAVCVALSSVLAGSTTAEAAQVEGLMAPHSFVADPSEDVYFISNINGEPDAKDNNGFITKLDQAGKVVSLAFIHGNNGTPLHAPKGLAIVGGLLYVADLDTLRVYDKDSGRPVTTIAFDGAAGRERGRTVALADVVYDGHGMLYVSDTEANTIYRVDPGHQHAVSVLASGPALAGPAGLAWNTKTGLLVAVSWNKGKILEITPTGTVTELVSNSFFSYRFRNLSGVDFDEWGSMYVSDFTAGKIWRIRPDMKFEVIAEYLPSPADVGIDRKNHLILVPYQYGNGAEINGLERPNTGRSKRSLSDYMEKGPGR